MNLCQALSLLPESGGAVVVLSGGMDSTIALRLCVAKYGNDNVMAVSYDYGQKQNYELQLAAQTCRTLKVSHKILDLAILGEITKHTSSNIKGTDIAMPTIEDVLGDAQPKTYVPYRNMILSSLTFAVAEANNMTNIVMGLQSQDNYAYWDTSPMFVSAVNNVSLLNRMNAVQIIAPFSGISKTEELEILLELDGNLDLLKSTLTCYNPTDGHKSCGVCPSCAERIQAFMNVGCVDPVDYAIDIPWGV